MAIVVMLIGSIAFTAFLLVRQLQREKIMAAPLVAKEADFRVRPLIVIRPVVRSCSAAVSG